MELIDFLFLYSKLLLFNDAIKLLMICVSQQVNESDKGARCNKAIMLITDGAPETYEEIFKRYNWPQKEVSSGYQCQDSKNHAITHP